MTKGTIQPLPGPDDPIYHEGWTITLFFAKPEADRANVPQARRDDGTLEAEPEESDQSTRSGIQAIKQVVLRTGD
jgi:hypothetical protein